VVDFLVSGAPVVNVILIVALVVGASRFKSFPYILFFFIYCAFHYSYAVPAMFAAAYPTLTAFHYTSNISALIAEAIFLLVWTFFVIKNTKEEILKKSNYRKIFVSWISIYLALFLLYYVSFPDEASQMLAVKDSISLLMMLFFAYMLSVLLQGYSIDLGAKELKWIIFASLLVLAIGFHEVFNESSWTRTRLPSGQILARASATMFNPNILGLWGMLLILFGGYLQDQKKALIKYIPLLFLLGTVGLYISGSRTALLLCLVLLMMIGVLKIIVGVKFTRAFRHMVVFVGMFFALCYLGSLQTAGPLNPLSERFLSMPRAIVNMFIGNDVNPKLLKSVYGRLGYEEVDVVDGKVVYGNIRAVRGVHGEGVYDNAYLALMKDNYMAFVAWLFMLFSFVVAGVSCFWRQRNIEAVYALSALACFMLIGFVIRAYQVFPVWGLSSLMLAVFIVWLSKSDDMEVENGVG